MFGILTSALFSVLGWLVKSVLVKFVLFFGLFYVTTELFGALVPRLPVPGAAFGSLSMLPASVGYFLDIFQYQAGMASVTSAAVTKFVIRRIPLIG